MALSYIDNLSWQRITYCNCLVIKWEEPYLPLIRATCVTNRACSIPCANNFLAIVNRLCLSPFWKIIKVHNTIPIASGTNWKSAMMTSWYILQWYETYQQTSSSNTYPASRLRNMGWHYKSRWAPLYCNPDLAGMSGAYCHVFMRPVKYVTSQKCTFL